MKKNLRDLTIKLLAELFMLAVFVTIIVGFIFVMTLILPLEKCICKEVVCITTKGNKMVTNENAHLYLPLLQALIDGKKLKHTGVISEAVTFNLPPGSYAIAKPNPWYRVALMQSKESGDYYLYTSTEDKLTEEETKKTP